ncbi:MAG: serine/threonine-protein kinase [Pirellulaceae bacterium]
MLPEDYQRAKAIFAELAVASESVRAARLQELSQRSPDVAREVRTLLEYHTAQSLVAPQSAPKIRTRSTLNTTYQTSAHSWLLGFLKLLTLALPFVLLAWLVGAWAHNSIYQSLQETTSTRLSDTVEARARELSQWEQQRLEDAIEVGEQEDVRATVEKLLKLSESFQAEDPRLVAGLTSSGLARNLAEQLHRHMQAPVKFAVWDRRMITIADWNQDEQPEVLGAYVTPAGAAMLAPVLNNNARLYLPRLGKAVSQNYKIETAAPILSIYVPIRSDSGSVVAVLMLRDYGLEDQYFELLGKWSSGPASETYLVNQRGAMISPSRYAERLESMGLATDGLGSRKAPLLRDPGVNLLEGETPSKSVAAWPATLLAREVTAGNSGVYVDGYRNYVGERVVGAWRWLPDHEIGIAVEEPYHAAYSILAISGWSMFGLSTIFTLAIIGLSLATSLGRLPRRRLRDLSEVGPYQVQELLGEGGMGRVYLAEHALLCRQSAIKVLTKGATDLSILSRFEREVQLASQLTHPNTIAIYDFGRNNDGVFYYAMEYINGAHLGQLIEYAGPIAPGRCIYILQQLCRALQEAHQAGVVHRDIKPQNIMVCNRGGEPDFVKLFDYGLVKAFAPGVSHNTSQTKIVVGTPRFMAPERLDSPWLADPRVDIYSVGALAYYLLTGKLPPLVTFGSQTENEQPGVETLDLPAGVVEFGGILSVCLSVEPAMRPSSMASLMRELDELAEKFPWTREDSVEWWGKHEGRLLNLVQSKRKKLNNRQDSPRV